MPSAKPSLAPITLQDEERIEACLERTALVMQKVLADKTLHRHAIGGSQWKTSSPPNLRVMNAIANGTLVAGSSLPTQVNIISIGMISALDLIPRHREIVRMPGTRVPVTAVEERRIQEGHMALEQEVVTAVIDLLEANPRTSQVPELNRRLEQMRVRQSVSHRWAELAGRPADMAVKPATAAKAVPPKRTKKPLPGQQALFT